MYDRDRDYSYHHRRPGLEFRGLGVDVEVGR
jgi:hypothetical protein